MELEHVVARLAEQVERRYYGKYRGFVVSNEDPEQLGRLQVTVPSVLGDALVTGWAMPCVPYGGAPNQGMLMLPDRGGGVWVEFEEGDLEFPIWTGTFWAMPGGETERPKANDDKGAEVEEDWVPPSRKILLKTQQGHTIQVDEEDLDFRILISDGQQENRIVLGEDGLTVESMGNNIRLTKDGVVIEDMHGNTITMSANGPFGPSIDLNGGGKRICLEGLVDWLLSHTHMGNMGAPTPLNPADLAALNVKKVTPGAGILSDAVTAK